MTENTQSKAANFYKSLIDDWVSIRDEMPWDEANPVWTKWVKKYLFDKGEKLGFKVESSSLPDGRGEGQYLVDLCWWKSENDKYWLELIVESEWDSNFDEINHDFYKLIDIKASLKLWICSWGERQMEKRRKELCNRVASARFKFPDEEYLILNLPTSEKNEYKDSLLINSFWIDNQGKSQQLHPAEINRYKGLI